MQAHNEFGKIEDNIYGIIDGCLTRIKEAYPHLKKDMVLKSVYDEIEIGIEDWFRYSCELRDFQIQSDELRRKIQRICSNSSRLVVRLQSELEKRGTEEPVGGK